MKNKKSITFGDHVCIKRTPETEVANVAGLIGQVFGETTPSMTEVTVIGVLETDYAINVFFEDHGKAFWFSENLIEFVDHAPGSVFQLKGVQKKWKRTESGDWEEISL